MAINPIPNGKNGIFRFTDYVSLIPDFLKNEEDVVTLLQVFSDYINNAYRNMSTVKKFNFKLFSLEGNVVAYTKKLQELADLFTLASVKDSPILFISKPDPSATNNFAQDPFTQTVDSSMSTVGGFAPRLVQFDVSDVSKVRSRKIKDLGSLTYHEIFFTAQVDNIKNVQSVTQVDLDNDGNVTQDYLVNYYNNTIVNPNTLPQYYIQFSPNENNLDWGMINSYVFSDDCAGGLDTFWENFQSGSDDLIIDSNQVNSNVLSGMYGSTFLNGYSVSQNEYINFLEYSADLYLYVNDGISSQLVINSGLVIGNYNDDTYSHMFGLSTYHDGIYLILYQKSNSSNVFTEKILEVDTASDIADILSGGNAKIKFGAGIVEFYWNNVLKYTLKNFSITSSKISIFASTNTNYGVDVNGFVDNVEFIANDDTLPQIPITYTQGSGLFYARTLTEVDKNPDRLDSSTQTNIYSDPLFTKRRFIIVNTTVNTSTNILTLSKDFYTGQLLYIDSTSTIPSPFERDVDYYAIRISNTEIQIAESLEDALNGTSVNILSTGSGTVYVKYMENPLYYSTMSDNYLVPYLKVPYSNLISSVVSAINTTTDILTVNSIFKTGTQVYIESTGSVPTELVVGIAYYAIKISNTQIKLATTQNNAINGIAININSSGSGTIIVRCKFLAGDRVARVDGLTISRESIGEIKTVMETDNNTGYIVIKNYFGDWLSVGEFAKVISGEIAIQATFKHETVDTSNNPYVWAEGSKYYKNNRIVYKGIKYKVNKAHTATRLSYPDVSPGIYIKDMKDSDGNDLIEYKKKVVYNPYMWGLFSPKYLDKEETPSFTNETLQEITRSIYIQTAEELDLKIFTKQREWLFNPRVAPKYNVNRNGFIEITMADDSSTDIVGGASENPEFPFILFTKQNLFDVTNYNPTPANSNKWYKFNVNEVEWQKKTTYDSSTFTISHDPDSLQEYIFNINISDLSDTQTIPVLSSTFTASYGTGILTVSQNFITGTKVYVATTGTLPVVLKTGIPYYVIRLSSTEIQLARTYNDAIDNISITLQNNGTGTHTISKKFKLVENDIVSLTAQTNNLENGKYRVINNSSWKRLDKKILMKIRDITVDFTATDDDVDSEDPIKYTTYTDSYIDDFISDISNLPAYKVEDGFVTNFKFTLEKVDNIDTTKPFHVEYDPKLDANTIADTSEMSKSFKGVPDMGMPLIEKIERIAYQKDPNIIDFELIQFLGRFMGYDITQISDDISESNIYQSDNEREMALRRSIENLPQYYALKTTKSSLEALLLAFGIVAEVVKLWTHKENPYDSFISDKDVINYIYSKKESGETVHLIPTPHFTVKVDIKNSVGNDLNVFEASRIRNTIIRYKPINTVFDGIVAYFKQQLTAKLSTSPSYNRAFMSFDVGYDIDFTTTEDNGI